MFANRFTTLIDACALAGALRRNLQLTLAEAEFFRVRWSAEILKETQKAIEEILTKKGVPDAVDGQVGASDSLDGDSFRRRFGCQLWGFFKACEKLPDQNDAHVLAAALKTQASIIVSDNLKHFPPDIIRSLNLEVLSSDKFIADTIALDIGRALPAIKRMRDRFKNPAMTGEELLVHMEAQGLIETVDVLKAHIESI